MKNKPIVSIIIPVWNSGLILAETVNSVSETVPYEIIIVDDGSTDPITLKTINQFKDNPKIKIIHQPNSGTTSARNAGVKISTGDYLLFLDSDDLIEPNFCTKMVEVFKSNPEVSYVYPDTILFGEEIGYWNSIEFDPKLLKYYAYFVITSLIKKSDFIKIGGFNDQFSTMDDREFWIRTIDKKLIGKKCHVFHFYRKLKTSKLATINNQRKIHYYENLVHLKYQHLYHISDYLNPKVLFYSTYFKLFYFVPQLLKTFLLKQNIRHLLSSDVDIQKRLPPQVKASLHDYLS